MILSNVEIHKALDAGDIVIKPEPEPRLVSLANPKSPYNTTAVDLRLSPMLSIADRALPMSFGLGKPGDLAGFLGMVYRSKEIDDESGFILKPNQFVLGNTVEEVNLPIREGRPVLAARVEGRSSFARCGLLIHFTAPTIHAGFVGAITFEIINLGNHDIVLRRNLAIAQLIFERVDGMPVRNNSQFHGQKTPAGK